MNKRGATPGEVASIWTACIHRIGSRGVDPRGLGSPLLLRVRRGSDTREAGGVGYENELCRETTRSADMRACAKLGQTPRGNGIHRDRKGKTTPGESTPIAPRCHQMGKGKPRASGYQDSRDQKPSIGAGIYPPSSSPIWQDTTTTLLLLVPAIGHRQTHTAGRVGRPGLGGAAQCLCLSPCSGHAQGSRGRT